MDAPMMVTRRDVVLGARAWQPAWHKWMFKATLRSTDRKSVISTLQKYNFWSLASHKIITNGIYKKDSGLQCPLTTYQKMQLCLALSKNSENRRNLAYVFDYQRGPFKNQYQKGAAPGRVLPDITYTGMCRPTESWFWNSWFRTG